jgi:hypothetical protein
MLNPSTADAMVDDPTVRRCMGFARRWGFSTVSIRNLFAFRATDPAELVACVDPVGERGDVELAVAGTADVVVAAWGAKAPANRVMRAKELLGTKPLYCLGLTKHGHPRHLLYVRADAELILFT